jgi:hypothetical protein
MANFSAFFLALWNASAGASILRRLFGDKLEVIVVSPPKPVRSFSLGGGSGDAHGGVL